MRIVQIIDSLDAGGAERIAINYANALAKKIEFSGLVATRKEGPLSTQINRNVPYLFLNKKTALDISSLRSLRTFVVKNKIEIVHAHGTSFFFSFLLKIICPKIKLIWHEHYGARVHQNRKNNLILIFTSLFFSAVFVVNYQLEIWVKKNLLVKKIFYMPNFVSLNEVVENQTVLYGKVGRRIVCTANLKNPKNHFSLLQAFKQLNLDQADWSLHLIGKDYNDEYSRVLKDFIISNSLEGAVFIYGSKRDIQNILSQSTIGVLCSTDEGFPVSLLEYGLAKLAVVSTNVGYCSTIIKDKFTGLLFNPLDIQEVQNQLHKMVSNQNERASYALNLHHQVINVYSEEQGVQTLIDTYQTLSI